MPLKLISEENGGILGACYEFDDKVLARAWANRKEQKEIAAELVVDRQQLKKPAMYAVIKLLLESNISVFQNKQRHKGTSKKNGEKWVNYDETDTTNQDYGKPTVKGQPNKFKDVEFFENMHHKFFIFRDNGDRGEIIIIGSYNWTAAASDRNWENIVILNDPDVITKFSAQWRELKQLSEPVPVMLLQ